MTNNEPKLCKHTHHSKPERKREKEIALFFMGLLLFAPFFFAFLFSQVLLAYSLRLLTPLQPHQKLLFLLI
jgi:hypothetical protein